MKQTAVKLNYSFFHTDDTYSDGDVEQVLLDYVQKNTDYEHIVATTDSFPIFYHLSKERECIVSPMHIKDTDMVLEIGSGCGALTGALASRAKHIDCIELSERRSLINAFKNSSFSNIEIFVGNYQDIQLERKYDVITLVGVFEYAKHYFHSGRPYIDFLNDVLAKLKPGGRLYIAIENRLGAKYFAGCVEDHAGRVFEGITMYHQYDNARTFSYFEWCDILKACNISEYRFMYPYPDYKFPRIIYSDDFLPTNGDFMENSSDYYSKRLKVFDDAIFLNSLNMENEFKIFSNSYLICITK